MSLWTTALAFIVLLAAASERWHFTGFSKAQEARKAKYQGVVVLSAIVRKDGTIEILKVVRGLGLGLDENAIQALKQWKFRPGMKNGVPVDVALNIEVNFSLR